MTEDHPQQIASVREGQILVGKYRVDRVLGVGGMGGVVAAHHLQLDTRVAIKFLRPSLLTNQVAVDCFIREARAAIQMNNEHVARVFDIGTLVTGAPYMVMEFLDGVDLGILLQQRGPLSTEEAIDFVLQASEAVAEAHALGIVHRDLKPTNLFFTRRPDGRAVIKVLDFGIAKVTTLTLAPGDHTLTSAPTLMGTPLYMSPEQIEASHEVDARTDIWALGVILYELLTGKTPFAAETLPEVSINIAARAPRPLRDFTPSVPEGLSAAIAVCLEKDPDKRYPNVAQLALALLPFGPRRARVSVERIADILQVPGPTAPPLALLPATGLAGRQADREGSPDEDPAPVKGARGHNEDPAPVKGARGHNWVGMLVAAGLLAFLGVGVMAFAFVAKGRTERVPLAPSRPVSSATPPTPSSAVSVALPPIAPPPPPSTVSVALPLTAPPSAVSAVSAASAASAALSPAAPAPVSLAKHLDRPPATPTPPNNRGKVSTPPPRLPSTVAKAQAAGVPAGPPAESVGAKTDCNPSFDLDDQGRKHFRPACLNARPAAATDDPAGDSNCDPKFNLDDQGRKHFKPECFLNPTP